MNKKLNALSVHNFKVNKYLKFLNMRFLKIRMPMVKQQVVFYHYALLFNIPKSENFNEHISSWLFNKKCLILAKKEVNIFEDKVEDGN